VGAAVSKRAQDLARLAADERTPEGERVAAALALAKLIAKEGAPSAASRPNYGGGVEFKVNVSGVDHQVHERVRMDLVRARVRVAQLEAQVANQKRTLDSMEEIAKHTQAELQGLRAELKAAQSRPPGFPFVMKVYPV
jgi:uncharacterized coiled-coil protein SlyX